MCVGDLFSPVSSTNNIDSHGITEMLLKVELNTIALQPLCLIVVKKGQHLMSLRHRMKYSTTFQIWH